VIFLLLVDPRGICNGGAGEYLGGIFVVFLSFPGISFSCYKNLSRLFSLHKRGLNIWGLSSFSFNKKYFHWVFFF